MVSPLVCKTCVGQNLVFWTIAVVVVAYLQLSLSQYCCLHCNIDDMGQYLLKMLYHVPQYQDGAMGCADQSVYV